MIIPQHKEQLAQFLRELAAAIESGEMKYRAFRVTPSTEHQILPNGEIERDAFSMAAELHILVESEKDYERLNRWGATANKIEDVAFHAGLRNRY